MRWDEVTSVCVLWVGGVQAVISRIYWWSVLGDGNLDGLAWSKIRLKRFQDTNTPFPKKPRALTQSVHQCLVVFFLSCSIPLLCKTSLENLSMTGVLWFGQRTWDYYSGYKGLVWFMKLYGMCGMDKSGLIYMWWCEWVCVEESKFIQSMDEKGNVKRDLLSSGTTV